jgi:hypothetical protein
MNKDDWYSTSMNTNNAEGMHAHSKRSGTRQTLVTAVQKSSELDRLHFEKTNIVVSTGVHLKYGNNSASGRADKNYKRNTSAAQRKKNKGGSNQNNKDVLKRAQDLVAAGVDPKVVELFLTTEKEKLVKITDITK